VWPGGGGFDTMFDPRDYFAMHTQGSRYAIPWAMWYVSGGKQGAIMKQVFDLTADAFETVGVCLSVNTYGIAKTNFMNMPKREPDSWPYPNPAPSMPQQFFFST
jgi:peptide/nickel transport system substrate-binding protein